MTPRFLLLLSFLHGLSASFLVADSDLRELVIEPAVASGFAGEIAKERQSTVQSIREGSGEDLRVAMEFQLPELANDERITRATFSISPTSRSTGNTSMEYALFSYFGNGKIDGRDGMGGTLVWGPIIDDNQGGPALQRVDVLDSVTKALAEGQTFLGLAIRSLNTDKTRFSSGLRYSLTRDRFASQSDPVPLLIVHVEKGEGQAAGKVFKRKRILTIPSRRKASGSEDARNSKTTAPDIPGFAHFGFDHSEIFNGFIEGSGTLDQNAPLIGEGSLSLTGNGRVVGIPSGIELPTVSDHRAVSIWFKTNNQTGSRDALWGWGAEGSSLRYDLRLSGTGLRIELGSGGHTFPQTDSVRDNEWHHALITLNGPRLQNHTLYVDGKFAGSPTSSMIVATQENAFDFSIGTGVQRRDSGGSTARDFAGQLDDFALFDSSLLETDAPLIHGFGRFSGISVSELAQLRSFWNAPLGEITELGGIRWIRAQNLDGPAGTTGGQTDDGNAFIVVDGDGGGFKQVNPASLEQLEVVGGDLDLSLGSGQTTREEITIRNSGSQNAEWRVIWDLKPEDYAIGTAVRNLAIDPDSYLDAIPDRHPFALDPLDRISSGIFSSNGARLFLDNLRLAYSPDLLEVETDQGVARYTTQYNDDFFAMSLQYNGAERFNAAGSLDAPSNVIEFDLISQNGVRYRVYTQFADTAREGRPAGCQLFILPDHPDLEIQAQPFVISSLPDAGHLYYLVFAKPENQAVTLGEIKDLCTRFLRQSENGSAWATGLPQSGVISPEGEQKMEIAIETLGLDPGTYNTRYAIAGLDTTAGEIPEAKWNDVQVEITPPDFRLTATIIEKSFPAGSLRTILPVTVEQLGNEDLTFTNLETSETWATARASESTPNEIEIDINADGLDPGEYRVQVVIETATTREIQTIDLTVEIQRIEEIIADPFKDRIYALNTFARLGFARSEILIYQVGASGWFQSIPTGENPISLALSLDGKTLTVSHRNGELWHFDTETYERKSITDLTRFIFATFVTTPLLQSGPGNTVIVNPSQTQAPLIIDPESNDLVSYPGITQDGNLYYIEERDEFFMAGRSSARRFVKQGDQYELVQTVEDRDQSIDRFFFSRDGTSLFSRDLFFDLNDLARVKQKYDLDYLVTNPTGSIVINDSQILDADQGTSLASFETDGGDVVVSPDSRLLYRFDLETRQIKKIDLVALIGEEALDLVVTPADGATVISPELLRWPSLPFPAEGATFAIHLAEEAEDLDANQIGTTANYWFPPGPLEPGKTYHWRVDQINSTGEVTTGTIYQFTTNRFDLGRERLQFYTITGMDGLTDEVELQTQADTAWTISSSQPWLSVEPSSGTGPTILTFRVNAEDLPLGGHSSTLTLTSGTTAETVPVDVQAVGMRTSATYRDPGSNFLYFNSATREAPFLEFYMRFNLESERYDLIRTTPRLLNQNQVRTVLHPLDKRLYFLSSQEGDIYINSLSLPDLTPSGPPVFFTGTDSPNPTSATSFLPGPPRVLLPLKTDGIFYDLENSRVIPMEVDGEPLDTRFSMSYSHPDSKIYVARRIGEQGLFLAKYDLDGFTLTESARSEVQALQTTPILISQDGQRLTWRNDIYDSDLNILASFTRRDVPPIEFSSDAEIAFSSISILNMSNGLDVAPLASPGGRFLAFHEASKKVFQFSDRTPEFFITDVAAQTTLSAEGVTPRIADDSTLFNSTLPLAWDHDAKATRYRVFLGQSRDAVAQAGPGDPEFLGETTFNTLAPPNPLVPDQEYFWRVDRIGFNGESAGDVFSFRTSSINTSPAVFEARAPWTVPIGLRELQLDSATPRSWTATTETPWIEILDESGNTPGTLRFNLNTGDLNQGTHEGVITLSDGERSWDYPVPIEITPLNIQHVEYEKVNDVLLAISQDERPFTLGIANDPAYLIVYDAMTGQPLRSLEVDRVNPDFHLDYLNQRILLARPLSNEIIILDLSSLEETSRLELPNIQDGAEDTPGLGLDLFDLSEGPDGTILALGATASALRQISPTTGEILDTYRPTPFALDGGSLKYDPATQSVLHVNRMRNFSTLSRIEFTEAGMVAAGSVETPFSFSAFQEYAPILLSSDASRIFAKEGIFDQDLNLIGTVPRFIQDLTRDEQFAITERGLYNLNNGLVIQQQSWDRARFSYAPPHETIWIFLNNGGLPIAQNVPEVVSLAAEEHVVPEIADGSLISTSTAALAWEIDRRAFKYEVYFGTDRAAVEAGEASALLGRTTEGSLPFQAPLLAGQEYFWRVDRIGYQAQIAGPTLSFRTRQLEITPAEVNASGPDQLPLSEYQLQTMASGEERTWTATSETPWLEILTPGGTTPETIRFKIDPESLPLLQDSPGEIIVRNGEEETIIPVNFTKTRANYAALSADPERPLIYTLIRGGASPWTNSNFRSSHLLVTDAIDESMQRFLTFEDEFFDIMKVDYEQGILYLAGSASLQIHLYDLENFALLQAIDLTDHPAEIAGISEIVPGSQDRLFLLDRAGLARVHLLDLTTEEIISSSFLDGGEHYWKLSPTMKGTTDSTGRWLYVSAESRLSLVDNDNPFSRREDTRVIRFDSEHDSLCADRSFATSTLFRENRSPVSQLPGETTFIWRNLLFDPELNPVSELLAHGGTADDFQFSTVSSDGETIYLRDRSDQLHIFDRDSNRSIFTTQPFSVDPADSVPTGRLFVTPFTYLTFDAPISTVSAPPGIRWIQEHAAPWDNPDGNPLVIENTFTPESSASWMALNIPYPAKVVFEWKTESPDLVQGQASVLLNGASLQFERTIEEWETVEVDLPEGGNQLSWSFFSLQPSDDQQQFKARLRNLTILRRGGFPGPITPTPTIEVGLDDLDFDEDGFSNLMEWLAGGDRRDPNRVPIFQSFRRDGELIFRFQRRLDRAGLELFPEISPDLQTWQRMGFPQVRQIDIDDTFETLELRIPATSGTEFIRLHAVNPASR